MFHHTYLAGARYHGQAPAANRRRRNPPLKRRGRGSSMEGRRRIRSARTGGALIYWTPSDRSRRAESRAASTIFDETQRFFAARDGTKRFGPHDRLVKEAEGLAASPRARRGRKPDANTKEKGKRSGGSACDFARGGGLDPDKEENCDFCNMSNWEGEARMSQNSKNTKPAGMKQRGTAWQVDSPLLDLALLDAREPLLQDGQYGRISPGRYNSIFIGGVIHELGHALGLPHNRERPDQKEALGTALMGSGNRTYGEERRGEGKGTTLTLGEALRLAAHPIFCGSVHGFDAKSNAKLMDVKLEPRGKAFTFSARVVADPPRMRSSATPIRRGIRITTRRPRPPCRIAMGDSRSIAMR